MEDLVLGFQPSVPPMAEIAAALKHVGNWQTNWDDGMAIYWPHPEDEDDDHRVYVHRVRWREFWDWAPEQIPANRMVLNIRYYVPRYVKEVVLSLSERFPFIIDTATGEENTGIISSAEFSQRCVADADWTWHPPISSWANGTRELPGL